MLVSSILPKNVLEDSNFCPSLLGQKFFVCFFGRFENVTTSFWNFLTFSSLIWIKESTMVWALNINHLIKNSLNQIHYRIEPYFTPTQPDWTLFSTLRANLTWPEFLVQNRVQPKKMGRVWPHYFNLFQLLVTLLQAGGGSMRLLLSSGVLSDAW